MVCFVCRLMAVIVGQVLKVASAASKSCRLMPLKSSATTQSILAGLFPETIGHIEAGTFCG